MAYHGVWGGQLGGLGDVFTVVIGCLTGSVLLVVLEAATWLGRGRSLGMGLVGLAVVRGRPWLASIVVVALTLVLGAAAAAAAIGGGSVNPQNAVALVLAAAKAVDLAFAMAGSGRTLVDRMAGLQVGVPTPSPRRRVVGGVIIDVALTAAMGAPLLLALTDLHDLRGRCDRRRCGASRVARASGGDPDGDPRHARHAGAPVTSIPTLPAAASPPLRARVLIVDDNVELVGTLHAVLMTAELSDGTAASQAIEVVTASRGDEGLAIAHARGFDVAIVDVKLPDASGVDLIPRLREASPFGEVVLITGFASMDAAIGALRSGAFAFVPKSFRPEELISTVEQALTKVRLARDRDELERRYRALVELTDVVVIGLDGDDRVALFNRKAAMFAGIEPGSALGRPFVESWIPDEDRVRACAKPSRWPARGGPARWRRGSSSCRARAVRRTSRRASCGRRRPVGCAGTCRWRATRATTRRSSTASAST